MVTAPVWTKVQQQGGALGYPSTLILTCHRDLQTGRLLESRAPCSAPVAAHPALVLCYHPQICPLPTAAAAAAYAADLQGPDWEVWGTAAMTDGSYGSTCRFDWRRGEAEEIKRRMEDRQDDAHPRFHSQSCRSQGNGSIWWVSYLSMLDGGVGLTPVTATVSSVGWNVGY